MRETYALISTADLESLRADIAALSAKIEGATIQPAPEWLSIADAAARLGVSTDTVRRRIDRGELQARGYSKTRQVRIAP